MHMQVSDVLSDVNYLGIWSLLCYSLLTLCRSIAALLKWSVLTVDRSSWQITGVL